jgi:nitrite reductase (NADH) large subunit
MRARKIVIVGNGMVGHYYAEKLAALPGPFEITVIGAETRPAYDRVHLSEIFAGKNPEDLALASRERYQALGIQAIFGEAVVAIDREAKAVTTALGRRFAYDKLVLATGSYPFVPPIPGADRPECLVYRTIDDLGLIRVQAQASRSAAACSGSNAPTRSGISASTPTWSNSPPAS